MNTHSQYGNFNDMISELCDRKFSTKQYLGSGNELVEQQNSQKLQKLYMEQLHKIEKLHVNKQIEFKNAIETYM
jgi:hypothetical protein